MIKAKFKDSSGPRQKVFVAMSGGVDSSVAAAMLVNGGKFDVVGVHIKCWSEGEYCTSERDAEDARRVAAKLGIPFYVFDLEVEYRSKVFDYMVTKYLEGETPNPDVMCNKEIKFGIFLRKALELGADYIATGHYIKMQNKRIQLQPKTGQPLAEKANLPQVEKIKNQNDADSTEHSRQSRNNLKSKIIHKLYRAKDPNKDQSYFLWTLTQERLKYSIFPLGDITKQDVRKYAKDFGFSIYNKKDSQGLCFVGEVDFASFLRGILPERKGEVVTVSGKKIGEHDGAEFYTIGQRKGIGVGGGVPYYVSKKDMSKNKLIVAEGPYDESLFKKKARVAGINWISGKEPKLPLNCEVMIRYRQNPKEAKITKTSSGVLIEFKESQRAVTPGQSAVFYKDDEMLGGGTIKG